MSTLTTVRPDAPQRRRRLGVTLALLAFAHLIIAVDYNIVFVALPEIGRQIGFSAQTLQWVVSAYAVAFGGFLLLGGRASDLLGRRRVFVAGLVFYAVSSLAGGLADSPAVLIAARAVQGLGGALLFPATLSLVTTLFAEGRQRNRALAVWSGSGAGGLVLGSLLGGLLTQVFGWEAVFFVNVPLAVLAIGLAFPLITADAPRDRGRRFDLPGALTGSAGVTLLVYALVQGPEHGWGSTTVVVGLIAAVALLAVFVVIERRTDDPLLPLRLLRNRHVGTSVVVVFLYCATFGAVIYFLTLYFQDVRSYSALTTGLAFLPAMVFVLGGNVLAGRLLTRVGVRTTLTGGLVGLAVATVVLATAITADGGYPALLPGLLLFGLTGGVTFTSMFAGASTGVAAAEQGMASGIASTGQQVGAAVGLAVLVAIANRGLDRVDEATLSAATADNLRTTVHVAAAIVAVTALVALNLRSPAAENGRSH